MKANDLSQFTFKFVNSGHYRVTYETPNRGDYYSAIITDMPLIDRTKNAEWAKLSDIKHLMSVVIRNGTHYSKWGEKL